MRKLMWFTVGFGAACAFCAYTWTCTELILPAIVFAVLFAAGIAAGKLSEHFRVAAVVCLGISVGLGWFQLYNDQYLSLAAQLDGKDADVSLYCTDFSYTTEYGSAVEGFLYLEGRVSVQGLLTSFYNFFIGYITLAMFSIPSKYFSSPKFVPSCNISSKFQTHAFTCFLDISS